jgi:hypothetical protein
MTVVLNFLAALTLVCSDWRLLPNGHWATVRPTSAAEYSMGTVEIDDLGPGMITTRQSSGWDLRPHPVDLFDMVNKECK